MRKEKTFFIIAVIIAIVHSLFYFTMIAGDAEIHLVYAQNAAAGHFFEFNLGEKSAGVTGPGYMLLLALFYKIFPVAVVPFAIKFLNYCSWYILIFMTYKIASHITRNNRAGIGAALLLSIMPGTAYNSLCGMENVEFAVLVLLVLYIVICRNWFDFDVDHKFHGFIIGLILGLSCWLRPEGVILSAIFFGICFIVFLIKISFFDALKRQVSAIIPFMVLLTFLILFHYSQTGHLVPSSGVARVIMGKLSATHIGRFCLSLSFIKLLVFYFPITFFFLFLVLKKYKRFEIPLLLMNLIILIFFIVYSLVLFPTHFSRYIIFLMPMIIICSINGFMLFITTYPQRKLLAIMLLLCLPMLAFGEIYARIKSGSNYSLGSLWHSVNVSAEKKARSNNLAIKMQHKKFPVSLVYQEVQARYYLDERFVIRSLDGRVDSELIKFVDKLGNFDHIGYIKARKIDYVMETYNYNADKSKWSLNELQKLSVGESLKIEGLTFIRHQFGGFEVIYE